MLRPKVPEREAGRLRSIRRPPNLFRFHSFDRQRDTDPERRGYLASTLRDRVIYVPLADEFNDPWEARPRFSVDSDPETAAQQLARFFIETGPWVEPEERRIAADIARLGLVAVLDEMQRLLSNLIRTTPILCLSDDLNNALMWGHYAAKHTGFALMLSTDAAPIAAALPVTYVPTYPAIDVARAFAQYHAYEAALLRKAEAWRYEREWRVVTGPIGPVFDRVDAKLTNVRGMYARLPPGAVTGIALGGAMDPADRAAIYRTVRDFAPSVEIVQCQLAADEFRVLIGGEAYGRTVLTPNPMTGR